MHLGNDRVIAAHDVGGLVVDPGPESCLEALLAALVGEPSALLLTHIHLDHAGASGALVRRFPDLRVYVHESGAAHLRDPSKLLRSAERLYGAEMERLWGEVLPVPRGERGRAGGRGGGRGVPRGAHARARLSPRLLPARGDGRRLRGRRRRRADPAGRDGDRSDAAAGHRPRRLGALARAGRVVGAGAPAPHPLRRCRRHREAARCRAGGPASLGRPRQVSRPRGIRGGRRVGDPCERRPRHRHAVHPGGAARPALAGPRPVLEQGRRN